jgi:ABC-type multidrug transport system ATPase subunit
MILTLDHLEFSFRDKTLFQDVSFSVPTRSIYGLLGENGSGKSTLMKMMLGLLEPSSGEILFKGARVTAATRIEYLRSVGSLIEHAAAYDFLTAYENLELARRIYQTKKGVSEKILQRVGLDKSNQRVKTFSLGMKQRLGIALALIGEPELVYLDEPTNGLDPTGLAEFKKLIRQINEEQGVTFLISSHHLSELEGLITHASILHKGVSLHNSAVDLVVSGSLNAMYFQFLAQE